MKKIVTVTAHIAAPMRFTVDADTNEEARLKVEREIVRARSRKDGTEAVREAVDLAADSVRDTGIEALIIDAIAIGRFADLGPEPWPVEDAGEEEE